MSKHIKVTTADTMQEEYEEMNKIISENYSEDKVNHPMHYQSNIEDLNIEAIDCMRAAFGNYEVAIFCKLNAFKYIWRASSKNGNEDIDKASWYLSKYRELGGENQ
jgi:hypothetical protein